MKRRTPELVAVAALLAGCSSFPWQSPAEPRPPSVWVEDPRAFAEEVAAADRQTRIELREEALEQFLRSPSVEAGVRLDLVFDHSVADIEDAHLATDVLERALDRHDGLNAESRAVLTSLLMRNERRIEEQRRAATMGSELVVLQEQYRGLQQTVADAEAARVRARRALADAEAKIRALMSIEQTLESGAEPGNGGSPPLPDSRSP